MLLLLFFFGAQLHAAPSSCWLKLDYTYTDIAYKEAKMTEAGRFPGIRGELGLGLTSMIGASVGGQYMEGNLNYSGETFSGASAKTVTKDYFSTTYGLIHLFFDSWVISGGIAQREWFNNLVISYRRRQTYSYYPLAATIYRGPLYFKAEWDWHFKGKNKTYMSDVNAAEHDVEFAQSSGSGYGAEVGVTIPTAMGFATHGFVAYHRWDIGDSDVQNDGVYNLMEPANHTTVIEGGIGVSF